MTDHKTMLDIIHQEGVETHARSAQSVRPPRSALRERDIRDFGCEVQLVTATRILVLEPLSWKAPSIAKPHCCYGDTVIFYVWPYEIVKPRKSKWPNPVGSYRKWDDVQHLLQWDTKFLFEGRDFIAGGGKVIRHRGGWWMIHTGRVWNARQNTDSTNPGSSITSPPEGAKA